MLRLEFFSILTTNRDIPKPFFFEKSGLRFHSSYRVLEKVILSVKDLKSIFFAKVLHIFSILVEMHHYYLSKLYIKLKEILVSTI